MQDDLISRQAVLDINESHHGQMPNHINHQIWQEIKDLPSVNPQKQKIDRVEYGTDGNAYRLTISNGKEFEQESCEDAISRQAVINTLYEMDKVLNEDRTVERYRDLLKECYTVLPSVNPQKIWHCKDCKWWKDSDGAFRRGIGAESRCPINREEVYEGNGYCFLFEPKESEGKE